MSCEELQQEEVEVLRSIYEGDDCFKIVDNVTFQYKIGDGPKSFLVEIGWTSNYPNEKPTFNMDTFYNKHILAEIKHRISQQLETEANDNLGTAMTYTLFEWAKENVETLMEGQPTQLTTDSEIIASLKNVQINKATDAIKEKKTQLTKAQKRKLYDRLDEKGERPRGWNWVDVVKHLSQTGSGKNSEVPSDAPVVS